MPHSVEIVDIEQVTHDVKKITVEKPVGYMFEPGFATEVAIQKKGWEHKKRPFTFTSIPSEQTLQFIIKIYDDHNGVTKKLNTLICGDHLLIGDAWGTIEYKGPGIFIAGGAGVTPFISIFRQLYADNKLSGNTLIFANKSEKDIILRRELETMLGYRFRNVITESMHEVYVNPLLTYLKGYVNEEYLKRNIEHIQQKFYVCGPPLFNESILKNLQRFGANANSMVFEQ